MIHLLFIFSGFLLSQSSILSINGFGETNNYQNLASCGAGDIELLSTSIGVGNPSGIATIWQNRNTSLRISNQLQRLSISNLNTIRNNIDLLSVSFPISSNKVFQIALNPEQWSQYSIHEILSGDVIEFNNNNFSYETRYYGRGGYSNFSTTFSQKLGEKFSFGISLKNYFGNKFQSDSTYIYDVSMDYNGEQLVNLNSLIVTNTTFNYHGYGLRFDGIYYKDKIEIGISYSYSGPFNIKQKKYFANNLIQSDELKHTISNLNSQFIIGFKDKINEKFGILAEFKLKKWKNIDREFLILKSQNYDQKKISIGSYYHFHNIDNKFFDSVTIRFGSYYKTYELISTPHVKDYAITFGSGFRYNNRLNSIDLNLIYGYRSFDIYDFQREKYIDLIIGIEVGEKWFKRKTVKELK